MFLMNLILRLVAAIPSVHTASTSNAPTHDQSMYWNTGRLRQYITSLPAHISAPRLFCPPTLSRALYVSWARGRHEIDRIYSGLAPPTPAEKQKKKTRGKWYHRCSGCEIDQKWIWRHSSRSNVMPHYLVAVAFVPMCPSRRDFAFSQTGPWAFLAPGQKEVVFSFKAL